MIRGERVVYLFSPDQLEDRMGDLQGFLAKKARI
jgi:hypothetical protein